MTYRWQRPAKMRTAGCSGCNDRPNSCIVNDGEPMRGGMNADWSILGREKTQNGRFRSAGDPRQEIVTIVLICGRLRFTNGISFRRRVSRFPNQSIASVRQSRPGEDERAGLPQWSTPSIRGPPFEEQCHGGVLPVHRDCHSVVRGAYRSGFWRGPQFRLRSVADANDEPYLL